MILVYITNPTKKHAKKIALDLLGLKLIACANIFPVTSIYEWDGKIQDEEEYVLIGKTKDELFDRVKKRVEDIHDSDVPCVIKIDGEANSGYLKWMKDVTV